MPQYAITFTVVQGISVSNRRLILSGVSQDSLVRPMLFNTQINDMQPKENDKTVAISVYTDDTNITFRSATIK
jgi:hypothetical protein